MSNVCCLKIFRLNKNKYFSEIHTKGLTVVALDLQSLKELTKANLCSTVPNGSSDKSGRVNTNVDTPNGKLFEDYLPCPKSLKANLSIDYSDDMAQLENCINVIQDSLESSIASSQSKEVSNKLNLLKGKSTLSKDIETVHCVSLESLDVEKDSLINERKVKHSKLKMNGDLCSQSQAHVKNGFVESKKVEKISIDNSKVVCDNDANGNVSLDKRQNTKVIFAQKTNQGRTVYRDKWHVYGKSKQYHVTRHYDTHKQNEKENDRAQAKNNKVANGSCTTFSQAADCKSKLGLPNGYAKNSNSLKANGYITINESNYIEINYDSAKHELTHSNSINGKLPNGNSHIMEDSPSNKYGGRGSKLYQYLFVLDYLPKY